MNRFNSSIRKIVAALGLLFCAQPAQANTNPSTGLYFDVGEFYGAYINPFFGNPINQSMLDSTLTSLFSNLVVSGTTQLYLSFAQLANINNYFTGVGNHTATDTIGEVLYENRKVGATQLNFIQYLIQQAHLQTPRISVDLSFGGELATQQDAYIIPSDSSFSAAGQAVQLAAFLANYGFDSVDFDIESNSPTSSIGLLNNLFVVNTPSTVTNFFLTLHEELSKRGILSVGTFLGDLGLGPQSTLAPFCQNMTQYFDGVNLMLYGGGNYPFIQFFLDWDNGDYGMSPYGQLVDWGLNQWLDYIKDPAKLRVGFWDAVVYTNAQGGGKVNPSISASAGYGYSSLSGFPTSGPSGAAAGFIYKYMLSQLTSPLTMDRVGQPFFWTNIPQCMVCPIAPASIPCPGPPTAPFLGCPSLSICPSAPACNPPASPGGPSPSMKDFYDYITSP